MSTVRLSASRWEMEIRPERGGRIASLRLDGEELLDQGIGVDQPTATGFVEGGAFGWDEIVPNLEPAATLPDHGEAWRLPWTVPGLSETSADMSCDGRLVSWRLSRRVVVDESVEVFYSYTNIGDMPHTAYWCAHPLFQYDAGMDVSVDVPRPPDGQSAKLFLPAGSVERVRLGRVQLAWDSRLCPDVAIWVCNGDLGGYRQIAVEPSWTRPDFAPGESCSWWLQIRAL